MDQLFDVLRVVLGGVLAIGGSMLAQRWTSRANTEAVRLTVNLAGKKDAYVQLADLLVRLRAGSLLPGVEASREIIESGFPSKEDWWSLQAKVAAYGSPAVLEAFDGILTQRTRLATARDAWEASRDSGNRDIEPLTHWRNVRKETTAQARSFLELINQELRST